MNKKLLSICHPVVKNNRGVTLIELIVVLSLITLVLFMAFQFFNFSGNMFNKSDELADRQNEGRLIVQGLRKDLGTALDISIVSSTDPDLFSVAAGSYAVYVKNGELVRKDSAGTVSSIYSSYPVDYLSIQFASTTSSIMHIAVSVEGTVIVETDVNSLNTTIKTDTASGFATSGNLVIFKPSA